MITSIYSTANLNKSTFYENRKYHTVKRNKKNVYIILQCYSDDVEEPPKIPIQYTPE